MFGIFASKKKGIFLSQNFLFALSLFVFQLVFIPLTQAKTLSVPESASTIKGALIMAKPGDIVLVSCGIYYEHDIQMKPGVALWSGTLQPGCVTIDAQGKGRHFIMADADSNTALVGFTLQGGNALASENNQGGSILCLNSSPRISNCIFNNNIAQVGGAISADTKSNPLFANCLFENNTAHAFGGGAHSQGMAIFRKCSFENNHALIGGGLALMSGSSILVQASSLQNNSAGNAGGAMHLDNAKCDVSSSLIADNWSGLGGSALSTSDSDLVITRSTLFRNKSDQDGGALAIQGKTPKLTNCIIAFGNGPVLRSDSEVPNFQGCNLFGNEGGDWVANLRSLANQNDNISSDPMFCSPDFGNFNLNNSSSCLPLNNPSGNNGIIGAFGPGCASADNIPTQQQPGSGFKTVGAGL